MCDENRVNNLPGGYETVGMSLKDKFMTLDWFLLGNVLKGVLKFFFVFFYLETIKRSFKATSLFCASHKLLLILQIRIKSSLNSYNYEGSLCP